MRSKINWELNGCETSFSNKIGSQEYPDIVNFPLERDHGYFSLNGKTYFFFLDETCFGYDQSTIDRYFNDMYSFNIRIFEVLKNPETGENTFRHVLTRDLLKTIPVSTGLWTFKDFDGSDLLEQGARFRFCHYGHRQMTYDFQSVFYYKVFSSDDHVLLFIPLTGFDVSKGSRFFDFYSGKYMIFKFTREEELYFLSYFEPLPNSTDHLGRNIWQLSARLTPYFVKDIIRLDENKFLIPVMLENGDYIYTNDVLVLYFVEINEGGRVRYLNTSAVPLFDNNLPFNCYGNNDTLLDSIAIYKIPNQDVLFLTYRIYFSPVSYYFRLIKYDPNSNYTITLSPVYYAGDQNWMQTSISNGLCREFYSASDYYPRPLQIIAKDNKLATLSNAKLHVVNNLPYNSNLVITIFEVDYSTLSVSFLKDYFGGCIEKSGYSTSPFVYPPTLPNPTIEGMIRTTDSSNNRFLIWNELDNYFQEMKSKLDNANDGNFDFERYTAYKDLFDTFISRSPVRFTCRYVPNGNFAFNQAFWYRYLDSPYRQFFDSDSTPYGKPYNIIAFHNYDCANNNFFITPLMINEDSDGEISVFAKIDLNHLFSLPETLRIEILRTLPVVYNMPRR